MTIWNKIRTEFSDSQHKNIRLKYLRQYSRYTNRNIIIYYSDFLSSSKPAFLTMLDEEDKHIIGDVVKELDPQKGLDVLIESPGGSPDAAEAIANMLRLKFSSVRFIVPNMAKSAATVLCLSGDEILMNEQSELGPIDPQMGFKHPNGNLIYSPAHLIIQQFTTLVQNAIENQEFAKVLAPYLDMYFPSFLQECWNAIEHMKNISAELLFNYMFKRDPEKKELAKDIAHKLSNFPQFLSHGRPLNIEYIKELGLNVFDLRDDTRLNNIVLYLYFSIKETFNRNQAIYKLIENNKGHGTVKHVTIKST